MATKVFKYQLRSDDEVLEVPQGGQILSYGFDMGEIHR